MIGEPSNDRDTITLLIHDLTTAHHALVRRELERLEEGLGGLRRLTADPRVLAFEDQMGAIASATRRHLDDEEREVFPACLALAQGEGDPARFLTAAHHLVEGHDGCARDLPRLLFMVRAIPVPAAGVAVRDRLHDALRSLCYDLPLHRHKEERVLLPAARRLACAAA